MLYKYRPINKNTIESIINSSLHFSHPSDFNDPFDSNIPVTFSGSSQEQIKEYFKKNRNGIPAYIHEEVFSLNDNAFLEKMISMINISDKQYFYKNASMCCFSRTNKNILMWSHYADSHKGIVLGFDSYENRKDYDIKYEFIDFDDDRLQSLKNSIGFHELSLPVWPVIYDGKKPNQIEYCNDAYDIMMKMLFKSPNWQYEEEMRIIFFSPVLDNNIEYKRRTLKEIIFGVNTNESDIKTIRKIVEKFYDSEVKYFKGEINETEYIIDFKILE